MSNIRYVSEEEYNAVAEEHSKTAAANERVAEIKKAWREGPCNLSLAEKLAALRKAANGEAAI